MNKLLLSVLACVSLFAFDATHYRYAENYKSALQKAIKADRALMVVIVSKNCPWCRKFERTTLAETSVNAVVQKNFTPLLLVKDKAGVVIPPALKSPIVPTVYFLDPHSEEVIYSVVGYQSVKKYLSDLNSAKENYALE